MLVWGVVEGRGPGVVYAADRVVVDLELPVRGEGLEFGVEVLLKGVFEFGGGDGAAQRGVGVSLRIV